MKKNLLFVFILFSFRLFAQPNAYRPFPEDSALWITDWTQQNNNPVHRDVYIMHGDTLINGVSYNKVYYEANIFYYPYGPSTILAQYRYLGGLRQDSINKKVYYRSASMVTDTLLYDFNLHIGDTLPSTYLILSNGMDNPRPIVTGIRDTLINGIHYNKFVFNSSSIFGHLIEGIGSDCGLFIMGAFWEGGPELHCFMTHNISSLQLIGIDPQGNSHYGQNECGFYDFPLGVLDGEENNFLFEIIPNPSTGFFKINSSDKFQFSVYDVFGREVLQSTNPPIQSTTLDLSSYPKGIYIVRVIPIAIGTREKIISRKLILQ